MSAAEAGAGEPAARRAGPLARWVFAALVAACFVALILTQRLKHTPTAVQRFELTPNFSPSGRHREEAISFKLSHAELATVQVIDADGDVVATLLRRYPAPRYKQISLHWNGRRGTAARYSVRTTADGHAYLVPATTGPLAPGGEYRVKVLLSRRSGAVLSPHSFTLVAR